MSDRTAKRKLGLLEARSGRRIRPELLIEIPAVLVTFVMMIHITANALLRTFARAPIAHTLEITEYWYMPIIVFIGFIAAQLRNEHTKADFIFNYLPIVTRRWVLGIAYIVITATSLGFAWFGLLEALKAFEVQRTAGASTLPAWPTTFLAPISFGVLTVQFAIFSIQTLRGRGRADRTEMDELEEVEEAMNHGA